MASWFQRKYEEQRKSYPQDLWDMMEYARSHSIPCTPEELQNGIIQISQKEIYPGITESYKSLSMNGCNYTKRIAYDSNQNIDAIEEMVENEMIPNEVVVFDMISEYGNYFEASIESFSFYELKEKQAKVDNTILKIQKLLQISLGAYR